MPPSKLELFMQSLVFWQHFYDDTIKTYIKFTWF